MYKVEKITIDNKVTTVQTMFKSAMLKDCVRFLYSHKDKSQMVILDRSGSVVDVGDYLVTY